jgi:hypothetical protein
LLVQPSFRPEEGGCTVPYGNHNQSPEEGSRPEVGEVQIPEIYPQTNIPKKPEYIGFVTGIQRLLPDMSGPPYPRVNQA